MIQSRLNRRSFAPRFAVLGTAFILLALVLGVNLARFATQLVPGAVCTERPAAVVYAPAFVGGSLGYTDDERARRLNAQAGYTVGRIHYAQMVHGRVRGRYAARW